MWGPSCDGYFDFRFANAKRNTQFDCTKYLLCSLRAIAIMHFPCFLKRRTLENTHRRLAYQSKSSRIFFSRPEFKSQFDMKSETCTEIVVTQKTLGSWQGRSRHHELSSYMRIRVRFKCVIECVMGRNNKSASISIGIRAR